MQKLIIIIMVIAIAVCSGCALLRGPEANASSTLDEYKLRDGLVALEAHGVTSAIREAAQSYRCAAGIIQCRGSPPSSEKVERVKNQLIEKAKHAPEPYSTNAFRCIDDYQICSGYSSAISCTTALVVCFAETLVASYKPGNRN